MPFAHSLYLGTIVSKIILKLCSASYTILYSIEPSGARSTAFTYINMEKIVCTSTFSKIIPNNWFQKFYAEPIGPHSKDILLAELEIISKNSTREGKGPILRKDDTCDNANK